MRKSYKGDYCIMFIKNKTHTYPVHLLLTVRSEGDTNSTDTNYFPKYYVCYDKTCDMLIPPSIGVSFMIWKPIKINEIILRGNEVICRLEDQILPSEQFEKLLDEYKFHLSVENWNEKNRV